MGNLTAPQDSRTRTTLRTGEIYDDFRSRKLSPLEILKLKMMFVDTAKETTDGVFAIDNANKQVVADLFDYFMCLDGSKYDTRKGLWIEGPKGTGKTMLMTVFSAFMRKLHEGFKIHLSFCVANRYAITGDLDPYIENLKGYSGQPVDMCFDELGKEPIPVKYFGTETNVFEYILYARYSLWQMYGTKTYVITNLKPGATERLYGEYVRDRRKEMFNIIPMMGESRRK